MRRFAPIVSVLALVVLAAPALSQAAEPKPTTPGRIQKRSYFFQKAGKEISYSLFVPKSYDSKKKAPLIVLLHGLRSNPSQVIRYRGITSEAEKRGYVVVAPYGYNDHGWYGSHGKGKVFYGGKKDDPKNLGELSEKDVMNVLDITKKLLSIDEDRIYLMGHSMGGGGTMHLGHTYPKVWAGLAPLAPAFVGSRSVMKKIRHIPIIVVTGDKDRLVKVGGVRRWVEKMKELEIDHVYKEIAGGNHFGTITNNAKMIAEVYDFFDSAKRGKKRKKAKKAKKAKKTSAKRK